MCALGVLAAGSTGHTWHAVAHTSAAPLAFDPAKIRIAADSYDVVLVQGGQEARVGTEVFDMHKDGPRFVLDEKIAAVAMGLEGTLTVTFGANLEPLERHDHGSIQGMPFDSKITVKDGRVTGTLISPSTELKPLAVNAPFGNDGILEEEALEVLLLSLPLSTGLTGTVQVFDDETGKPATTTVTVEGKETMQVPAGKFEVFKIRVQSTEATMVYVSTTAPARIICVKEGGQPVELRLRR